MIYPSQLVCLVSFLPLWGEVSAFTGCKKSILTVKYVPSCPTDEVSWKEKAREMNCDSITQNCAMSLGLNTQNNRFQYHCLMNSHMSATVEVCALNRTIFGFCAEFDINGAVVQENYAADCKKHNKPCPEYYDSAEAYNCKTSPVMHWLKEKPKLIMMHPNLPILEKLLLLRIACLGIN